MPDLLDALKETKDVSKRATLLREHLQERLSQIESLNGGRVLPISELNGIKIGEYVEYIDGLGKRSKGYVSHFFRRYYRTAGSLLSEACKQVLALSESVRASESDAEVLTIIFSESGGYSTHHSPLPLRTCSN